MNFSRCKDSKKFQDLETLATFFLLYLYSRSVFPYVLWGRSLKARNSIAIGKSFSTPINPIQQKNPNVSQRSEISFHFPRKNLWGKCTINLSFYFSKNCHKGRGFFFFGWGKFSFFGWKFCGNLRIYTILHYYE